MSGRRALSQRKNCETDTPGASSLFSLPLSFSLRFLKFISFRFRLRDQDKKKDLGAAILSMYRAPKSVHKLARSTAITAAPRLLISRTIRRIVDRSDHLRRISDRPDASRRTADRRDTEGIRIPSILNSSQLDAACTNADVIAD